MPVLRVFTPDQPLPPEYECQIRAYIRLLWYDAYLYDVDELLVPPERHPHFVVLAERHALISAARVSWVTLNYRGQEYKTYILGDVFTYPAFRSRGYGTQVVQRATTLIRTDASADLGVLFTGYDQGAFYQPHGWEALPHLTATQGDPGNIETKHALCMMQFLSERARAVHDQIAADAVHFPGYGW
jgi:GNAT superfamily N-acetyltransferase